MTTHQAIWTVSKGWNFDHASFPMIGNDLLLLFGAPAALTNPAFWSALESCGAKAAHTLGCTTAGEICNGGVMDDTVVATAVQFDRTRVRVASRPIRDARDSIAAGREIAAELDAPDLVNIFVLSCGLSVNGTELVAGLTSMLSPGVTVTGGLSADGSRFQSTHIVCDGPPRERIVAAAGFYGSNLHVGCGSMGGWDAFGPDRLITRSEENVLFELDGKSALQLYKKYLGDHAKDLPASGLLFPLLIHPPEQNHGVVRTILSIDEAAQSMTFAGDMPEGWLARLMKANFDRLIDGATGAAKRNLTALDHHPPDLAILISCVGRKLVLQQRIDEEVDAVREIVGSRPMIAGFYSYGEISPFSPGEKCDLHNQTMTVTTFSETSS
jgi:hypothetical protein